MESFREKDRVTYLLAACVCTLLFSAFSGCSSDPRLDLVENGLKPPVAEKVEDFIADSDIDSHDTVFTEFSYQKNSDKLMELGFDSDLSEQTNSADSQGQFQDLTKLQQEAINGNLNNKSQQNTLSNNEDSQEMPTGEFVSFLETEDSAEESQTKESLVSLEQSFKQDNADIKVDSAIERSKVEEQGIPGLKDSTMLSMADESEEKLLLNMKTKSIKLSEYDKHNDFSDNPLSPTKNIITISMAEALRLSFSGNPDVIAASYASKQAEEKVNANKSVYDTVLYANTNTENKNDLDADYYYKDPDPGMLTDGWSVEGGIQQHLPTGGDMTAGYEYAETKQHGVGKDVFRGLGGPFISIKQPLLRGLSDVDNRTAIKVSLLNVSMAQADFMTAAMDSVYDVCASYWNMVFYMESMAIQKRTLEMAKEVYKYEVTRKDNGISRNLSVERARAAVDVRKTHLLQARDNVHTALDQMVIITGGEDEFVKADLVLPTDQPLTAFVTPDTEMDLKSALTLRPELKRGYSGIEIGKLRREQAKYNTLPTVDLQAKYGLSSGDLGMNDHVLNRRFDRNNYDSSYWNVGINFNYQVGSRASLSRMREAEALIDEKKAELVKRTRQIKIEVRAAERSLVTSRKKMKLTFNAKEAALRVMEGERIRLKLGMSTNEELLRAQDYYAQRETEYFRAIIDCNISALKLARARGTILSELGIEIAGAKQYTMAFPYSVKSE